MNGATLQGPSAALYSAHQPLHGWPLITVIVTFIPPLHPQGADGSIKSKLEERIGRQDNEVGRYLGQNDPYTQSNPVRSPTWR